MVAPRLALTVVAVLTAAVLTAPAQQGANQQLPRAFKGFYETRGGGAPTRSRW